MVVYSIAERDNLLKRGYICTHTTWVTERQLRVYGYGQTRLAYHMKYVGI